MDKSGYIMLAAVLAFAGQLLLFVLTLIVNKKSEGRAVCPDCAKCSERLRECEMKIKEISTKVDVHINNIEKRLEDGHENFKEIKADFKEMRSDISKISEDFATMIAIFKERAKTESPLLQKRD